MSEQNVIQFLRMVAARRDILDTLKVQSKDDVIATAAEFGLPFEESEFDPLIWNLEAQLAQRRGEAFDQHFPLWHTMWGQYYLEYLVLDLLPSLRQSDFDAVMKGTAAPT